MSSENKDAIIDLLKRLVDATESQSVAIQSLAANLDVNRVEKPRSSVSRQSEAMVWAIANSCTDVKVIADQFEVTERTVRRWSQLRTLIDRMDITSSAVPAHGGSKVGGEIEAW